MVSDLKSSPLKPGTGDTKLGAAADADGYLCVYADGTAIKVKNRTGATATVGWCVMTW